MSFARVLVDSFILLKKCPKLFIPKILISFLMLPIIILITMLLINLNLVSPEIILSKTPEELRLLLMQLIFLIVYTPIIYFIDYVLVNPMYPVMIEQFYKKKKVNFRQSFLVVLKRFGTIFSSVVIFSILFFGTTVPLGFITLDFWQKGNDLMFYIFAFMMLIAFFVILLLFYLLYPVSSIEKLNISKTLNEMVRTSLKHKSDVLKAIIISILVSGLSFFFSNQVLLSDPSSNLVLTLVFFSLLIITRFLIAIFVTYQYVLNAVFYFHFEKKVFFKR